MLTTTILGLTTTFQFFGWGYIEDGWSCLFGRAQGTSGQPQKLKDAFYDTLAGLSTSRPNRAKSEYRSPIR